MKLKDLNKKIDSLNEAVSMNISMSGDSADDVATLMKMVKDSGGAPEVVKDIPSLGMRGDIEKSMAAIKGLDGPDMGPEGPEDMGDIKAKIMPMPDMGCEDEEVPEGEWDNSPDEQHQDTAYMQNDLAGGLNRPKKSYPKVAGGDNPMALEEVSDEMNGMISNWIEKFSKFRGGNGDTLPDGYIQWALNSGITTDFVEENEAEAMREKHGEDEFENNPLKYVDEMPITKAALEMIEKITGDDDIDTNARMIDKVQSGDADESTQLEDEIKAELTAKLGEMMKEEKDAEAKFDEAGCKKKMKKLNASGCTKEDMKKKITAEYGCNKSKFEELYASSCGSH